MSDRWLAVLRIGLAVQVILYLFSLRNDWQYFLAGTGGGLISRDMSEAMLSIDSRFVPRIGWLVDAGQWAGFHEGTILPLLWIALLCAAVCLGFGFFSRTAAVSTWLLHLFAVKSADLLAYGMDNFTTIGLFYLMLAPLPDRFSLDWRWRGRRPRHQDLLGFWQRVLQIHLCVIYFFGGLSKAIGHGWWTGDNLWQSLTHSPFNIIPPDILAHARYFYPLLGICVWVLELGYPVFIWPGKTRKPWLAAMILMHGMIGLTMGMYLFSLIMITLNMAAFGAGSFFRRSPLLPSPDPAEARV